MRTDFAAQDFEPCLNQVFHIHIGDGGRIDAELVEIRGLTSHTRREDRSPFSLLFRGPAEAFLEQQIFHLENDDLGELDLFLVTLGPDPDDDEQRPLYEAIFT